MIFVISESPPGIQIVCWSWNIVNCGSRITSSMIGDFLWIKVGNFLSILYGEFASRPPTRTTLFCVLERRKSEKVLKIFSIDFRFSSGVLHFSFCTQILQSFEKFFGIHLIYFCLTNLYLTYLNLTYITHINFIS